MDLDPQIKLQKIKGRKGFIWFIFKRIILYGFVVFISLLIVKDEKSSLQSFLHHYYLMIWPDKCSSTRKACLLPKLQGELGICEKGGRLLPKLLRIAAKDQPQLTTTKASYTSSDQAYTESEKSNLHVKKVFAKEERRRQYVVLSWMSIIPRFILLTAFLVFDIMSFVTVRKMNKPDKHCRMEEGLLKAVHLGKHRKCKFCMCAFKSSLCVVGT